MKQLLALANRCLRYVFDIVFPPSAESLLVRDLKTQQVLALTLPMHIEGIVALSSFKEAKIRALIHEAKFRSNDRAIRLLGVLLSAYLGSLDPKENLMLIPIPLSRIRARARGYNQVEEVLKSACTGRNKGLVVTKLLVRTRDTQPQTDLPRDKRWENVANAFSIRDTKAVYGKHILLIDDVSTTGATLNAAKAALLPHHPASVTCIALAH